MPRCIVVPGFLASTMYTVEPFRFLLWVNVSRLALGHVGALRLAPNGSTPGAPDGVLCEAGEGLSSFVEVPAAELGQQLAPHDYTVEVWAYDWRKELFDLGSHLATRIRAVATAADPCSLVCHSTGGLVARAAWFRLNQTGDTARVRRIVTLGTPHNGTYAAPKVMSQEDALIDQLVFLSSLMAFTPVSRVPGFQLIGTGFVQKLAQTWPALYCLFPALPAPAFDPHRAMLYDAQAWSGPNRPSPVWLSYARNSWWPLVKSPEATPPPWVLTTVAGVGWETAERLAYPDDLGARNVWGTTTLGDSVVTRESAFVVDAAQVETTVRHEDMLPHLVRSGDVARWVLEVRLPPNPAPPLEALSLTLPPEFQSPPITELGFPGSMNSPCLVGDCPC